MKTITEFSGSVLREAARVLKAAAPPPAEEPAAGAGEGSAPAEGDTAAASSELATLGLAGDRLSRMTEALTVVGDDLEGVRRVRVMQAAEGEALPPGAKK